MHCSTLSAAFSLLHLALAQNGAFSGGKCWNTTSAQLTTAPGVFQTTNNGAFSGGKFWNTTSAQPTTAPDVFQTTNNGAFSGGKFWNTTSAQPTTAPDVFQITNDSSTEAVVTIQLEISGLSGSGIINLSNVAGSSSLGGFNNLLVPTSSMSSFPYETQIPCQNLSLPSTTTNPPQQPPVALNTTVGGATLQPSASQISTNSPSDFALFNSSGVSISHRLSSISVFLAVTVAWLL